MQETFIWSDNDTSFQEREKNAVAAFSKEELLLIKSSVNSSTEYMWDPELQRLKERKAQLDGLDEFGNERTDIVGELTDKENLRQAALEEFQKFVENLPDWVRPKVVEITPYREKVETAYSSYKATVMEYEQITKELNDRIIVLAENNRRDKRSKLDNADDEFKKHLTNMQLITWTDEMKKNFKENLKSEWIDACDEVEIAKFDAEESKLQNKINRELLNIYSAQARKLRNNILLSKVSSLKSSERYVFYKTGGKVDVNSNQKEDEIIWESQKEIQKTQEAMKPENIEAALEARRKNISVWMNAGGSEVTGSQWRKLVRNQSRRKTKCRRCRGPKIFWNTYTN